MAIYIAIMQREFSIAQARDRLPALVHVAERGTPIALTRRGRRVAVLVSAGEFERRSRTRPGTWEALEAFRRRHRLSDLDARTLSHGTRDRSSGRRFRW